MCKLILDDLDVVDSCKKVQYSRERRDFTFSTVVAPNECEKPKERLSLHLSDIKAFIPSLPKVLKFTKTLSMENMKSLNIFILSGKRAQKWF